MEREGEEVQEEEEEEERGAPRRRPGRGGRGGRKKGMFAWKGSLAQPVESSPITAKEPNLC